MTERRVNAIGTRADFYVGRGKQAEWLGSVAWDGDPEAQPQAVKDALLEGTFRTEVARDLAGRDDATLPEMGWPWPWKDSRTTDYAYAFDEGEVWASHFGRNWFPANAKDPDDLLGGPKTAEFPDMSERMNVTWGNRSGVLIVSKPGES